MKWGVASVAIGVLISVFFNGTPASASVDDFYFSDFTVDYYLSKDDEGRSILKVDESLTAEFPPYQQNKGIVRAIPLSYDGHPVSLEFDDTSLMRDGQSEPIYEKVREGDNLIVSTGTDEFVLGTQTYQFSYTMRDVIKDFGDHQEFYWDINGTEWRQSFGTVIANVHLDPSIAKNWTEQTTCYQGYSGSNQTCTVTKTTDPEGRIVVSFQSTRMLGVGENATLVMGFHKETFQPYQMGALDYALLALLAVMAVVTIGAFIWSIILRMTHKSASGRGVIVPEYLPPKDVSIVVASELSGKSVQKNIASQVVDLAVRHNIQIIEYEKKQFFGSKKAYKLVYKKDQGLNDDERKFVQLLFPTLSVDAEFDMADQSATRLFGMSYTSYHQHLVSQMVSRQYRYKIPGRYVPAIINVVAMAVFVITVINMNLSGTFEPLAVSFIVIGAVLSTISIVLAASKLPLTEKGAELRDYVKGLKMYINVAEKERLAILQSVQGAARVDIGDISDKDQLVKLYERVLPYAVLFGLESSWGRVLETYYEDKTMPSWYVGTTAFNATSFASSINSFASSTSSSSSGFGGGGSSGGGGGGGGGGGR